MQSQRGKYEPIWHEGHYPLSNIQAWYEFANGDRDVGGIVNHDLCSWKVGDKISIFVTSFERWCVTVI